MLTGAGRTITWDVENRPVSIVKDGVTTTFVYDGDGKRIKQTVGAVVTTYINQYYEKSGTDVTTSYYLGGKLIALRKGSGSTFTLSYVLQDHLGSTNGTADSTGAATSTIRYFSFGGTRTSTGTMPTDKKFTGQRLDSTGLYYYNARYYDPVIGRFISADIYVQNPANPQTLNRYSYCSNNPLKYTDPSGHEWGQDISNVINYQNLSMIDTSMIQDLPQYISEVVATSEYQAYSAFASMDPAQAAQIQQCDQTVNIKFDDNLPLNLDSTTRTSGTNVDILLNGSLKGTDDHYIAGAIGVASADIVSTFTDRQLEIMTGVFKVVMGAYGVGSIVAGLILSPVTLPIGIVSGVGIYGGSDAIGEGINGISGDNIVPNMPDIPIPGLGSIIKYGGAVWKALFW
jgi:RHS repeat-associated protein